MGLFSAIGKASQVRAAQRAYVVNNCLKGEQKALFYNYFGFVGGCCKKPWTDKKYQEMVDKKEKSVDIKALALSRFNLRESDVKEIEPIRITSFERKLPGGVDAFVSPSGLKTNEPSWTYIFFGDKQIYVFKYVVDMLTNSVQEDAVEYFYKDIVSFHTVDSVADTNKLFVGGCAKLTKKEVNLKNYICEFKIVVPGDDFHTVIEVNDPKYISEKVTQARVKLREKKAVVRVEK